MGSFESGSGCLRFIEEYVRALSGDLEEEGEEERFSDSADVQNQVTRASDSLAKKYSFEADDMTVETTYNERRL